MIDARFSADAFATLGPNTPAAEELSRALGAVIADEVRSAVEESIRRVVEQLCALFNVAVTFAEVEAPYLVTGRAASVAANNSVIGVFGQLLPSIADARGLPADARSVSAKASRAAPLRWSSNRRAPDARCRCTCATFRSTITGKRSANPPAHSRRSKKTTRRAESEG